MTALADRLRRRLETIPTLAPHRPANEERKLKTVGRSAPGTGLGARTPADWPPGPRLPDGSGNQPRVRHLPDRGGCGLASRHRSPTRITTVRAVRPVRAEALGFTVSTACNDGVELAERDVAGQRKDRNSNSSRNNPSRDTRSQCGRAVRDRRMLSGRLGRHASWWIRPRRAEPPTRRPARRPRVHTGSEAPRERPVESRPPRGRRHTQRRRGLRWGPRTHPGIEARPRSLGSGAGRFAEPDKVLALSARKASS